MRSCGGETCTACSGIGISIDRRTSGPVSVTTTFSGRALSASSARSSAPGAICSRSGSRPARRSGRGRWGARRDCAPTTSSLSPSASAVRVTSIETSGARSSTSSRSSVVDSVRSPLPTWTLSGWRSAETPAGGSTSSWRRTSAPAGISPSGVIWAARYSGAASSMVHAAGRGTSPGFSTTSVTAAFWPELSGACSSRTRGRARSSAGRPGVSVQAISYGSSAARMPSAASARICSRAPARSRVSRARATSTGKSSSLPASLT